MWIDTNCVSLPGVVKGVVLADAVKNYRSAKQRKAESSFIEIHFKREMSHVKGDNGPKRFEI